MGLSTIKERGWHKIKTGESHSLWKHTNIQNGERAYYLVRPNNEPPTKESGGYYTIEEATKHHKELRGSVLCM